MARWLQSFNRLQWKLTLSYTLVTTAAVLVAMLAPALLSRRGVNNEQVARLIAFRVQQSAAQLEPYLAQTPPDQVAAQEWVVRSTQTFDRILIAPEGQGNPNPPPPRPQGDGGNPPERRVRIIARPVEFVTVVDAQGKVIAANWNATLGDAFPVDRFPGASVVFDSALRGETDPLQLVEDSAQSDLFFVAAPIRNEQGQVLGALIRSFPTPPNATDFVAEIVRILLPLSLVVLLIVGLVGTVFGYFTARGLTTRLGHVSEAATAWTEGDFAAQARDTSGDELGQLAQQLNHMAAQLERLVQTREQLAALEERNRLARDVHDSVKQQVFAITMNLGAAQALWPSQPGQARARLDDAATLARQAQQELTDIIQTLRSAPLEEKGLAQAVWETVRAWEKGTGVTVTDEIRVTAPVPGEVAQAVFRICQEALANIARHSGARAARVRVTTPTGALRLEISDNGSGFDPQQPSQGVGLNSMRERVEALGGQFGVQSDAHGTRLRVVIPLETTEGVKAPA